MRGFMIFAIVFVSIPVFFYFLWVNGYMVLNVKRAVLFVGSLRGRNHCEASFTSCSGYVKRVIKFSETRGHTFHLDSDVSNELIIYTKGQEFYSWKEIDYVKINTAEQIEVQYFKSLDRMISRQKYPLSKQEEVTALLADRVDIR